VSAPAISKERLAELTAKLRQKRLEQQIAQAAEAPYETLHPTTTVTSSLPSPDFIIPSQATNKYGELITYNEQQQEAIRRIAAGEDVIIIGPAGTGKTTCVKGALNALIHAGIAGTLQNTAHKHLTDGTPGIVAGAFTRRATVNIRNNVSDDMKANCITLHKLVEYQPVYYEITDPATGSTKTTMRFEPTRNETNPLPESIHTQVFEESTMISVDLHTIIRRAYGHRVQTIYIGDIQQLPPVFGPAILGFKMLELPIVELKEVYRQALESPIMRLLHRILSGKTIPKSEFKAWHFPGQLRLVPWEKKISWESAVNTCALFFVGNMHTTVEKKVQGAFHKGLYDPEQDIILIPFNKKFGTVEMNKHIANALARHRSAVTHEIIAGFEKHYLSVGDKVLYDKEDATVLDIYPNPTYVGSNRPQKPATTLDYWGHNSEGSVLMTNEDADTDMDFILSQAVSMEKEDRVHAASHRIVIRMNDSDTELTLDKASEINSLLLGYCLTVHKAQGSEWRRVFFLTHESHNQFIYRELMYTACSRAREELFIICEPDHFEKGITTQRIKGETLAEKAEYFKGKIKEGYEIENV